MKIFLSWSGEESKSTAKLLQSFIRQMVHAAKPWYSDDIEKGRTWNQSIGNELSKCEMGIICLNRNNLNSTWIHFEAGAISRRDGNVVTFLLDLNYEEIIHPLAAFQHTLSTERDIFKLIIQIRNKVESKGGPTIPDKQLEAVFKAFYPQLKKDLEKLARQVDKGKDLKTSKPLRSQTDILYELLNSVREIQSSRFKEISEETINRLESLYASHEYFRQQQVLLRKTKVYGNLVIKLLEESVAEQHKMLARINPNGYLYWLEEAIKSCDSYFTLQRNPPRWFDEREGAGTLFLRALRDKKMVTKTRIFVVDSGKDMLSDLKNKKIMENYWSNTGNDVNSFWITTQKLKSVLEKKEILINDMVLCNNELLFQYESENKVLKFDVMDKDTEEESMGTLIHIKDALDRQLKGNMKEPFNRIVPPASK